ncbi:MAG: hypothetical protein KGL52_05695 [Rhodospirillales bacterium]|nr:hypothetical protein [Rhodospirillales bacterium]
MSEPRRAATVFWGRVDHLDNEFRARWGVRDSADGRPAPELPETSGFACYDDAYSWVHLSAAQAGFATIAWDADSCPAPEDSTAE